MPRESFNAFAAVISIGLGVLSLLAALTPAWTWPFTTHERLGYFIVGFWTLVPPVFFWVDWVYFSAGSKTDDVKHTHDLSRNIWLALVIILAALFHVKMLPT